MEEKRKNKFNIFRRRLINEQRYGKSLTIKLKFIGDQIRLYKFLERKIWFSRELGVRLTSLRDASGVRINYGVTQSPETLLNADRQTEVILFH